MPTFAHYVLSVPVEMLAVAVLALIGGVYLRYSLGGTCGPNAVGCVRADGPGV